MFTFNKKSFVRIVTYIVFIGSGLIISHTTNIQSRLEARMPAELATAIVGTISYILKVFVLPNPPVENDDSNDNNS